MDKLQTNCKLAGHIKVFYPDETQKLLIFHAFLDMMAPASSKCNYCTINRLFSSEPTPTVGNSGDKCHSPSTKNLISYLCTIPHSVNNWLIAYKHALIKRFLVLTEVTSQVLASMLSENSCMSQ